LAQKEGWVPIRVGRAVVVDLETVTCALSDRPDSDWIAAFRDAPVAKIGGMQYIMSGSEPMIHGQEVEWKVGPKDHLDANSRVRAKAAAANDHYLEVLKRRAAERERAAEETRVRDAAIQDAQRLLDEAGDGAH